jgi:hypothetical protein
VAVRGVGVVGDGDGTLMKIGDLNWCKRRHGESEAIGCAGLMASGVVLMA